jgi:uncharacterized protein (DUF1697 family)
VALVVFLRGLNVGGHRTFRPTTLARQLQHLGAVNVGAAGTLVIRQPVSRLKLRAEIRLRLPFDAEIMICQGSEIRRLLTRDYFAGHPVRPGITRFVSLPSRLPRSKPPLPLQLPSGGRWLLKVLAQEGRFVVGMYRRRMKVIDYLDKLDRLYGAQATTRSWSTLTAISKVLDG